MRNFAARLDTRIISEIPFAKQYSEETRDGSREFMSLTRFPSSRRTTGPWYPVAHSRPLTKWESDPYFVPSPQSEEDGDRRTGWERGGGGMVQEYIDSQLKTPLGPGARVFSRKYENAIPLFTG